MVLRALAKRPEDRYASAAELSAALGEAVALAMVSMAADQRPLPGGRGYPSTLDDSGSMVWVGVVVVLGSVVVSAVMALLISRAL